MKASDLPSGENAGAISPMMFSGGIVTWLLAARRARRSARCGTARRRVLVGGREPLARPATSRGAGRRLRCASETGPRSCRARRRRPATRRSPSPSARCAATRCATPSGDHTGLRSSAAIGRQPERLRGADGLDVDIGVLAGLARRRVDDLLAVGREGGLELAAGSAGQRDDLRRRGRLASSGCAPRARRSTSSGHRQPGRHRQRDAPLPPQEFRRAVRRSAPFRARTGRPFKIAPESSSSIAGGLIPALRLLPDGHADDGLEVARQLGRGNSRVLRAGGRSAVRRAARRANRRRRPRSRARRACCSGLAYSGVIAGVTVTTESLAPGSCSGCRILAMPKSSSLGAPSPVTRMLPGLMSRCTTPRRCAKSTAAQIVRNSSSRSPRRRGAAPRSRRPPACRG